MKNRFALGAILGVTLASSLPMTAQTAYSHDSSPVFVMSNWMSQVNDSKTLSQLSLPGTHETLSLIGGDAVQCQSMSLGDQLQAGIRVIDIRLGPGFATNQLLDYHGSIYQSDFSSVMYALQNFLSQHRTETVLMRVDNEAPNGSYYGTGLTQLSTSDFVQRFNNYWNEYGSLFYNPSSSANRSYGLNPPLSAMRGKVVVLDHFSPGRQGPLTPYGLNYDKLNAQDDYTLNDNWDLYNKWEEVETQLLTASIFSSIGNPSHTVFINYLSGSGGSFPYFVASGKSSPGTNAPQLMTGETTPGWNNYPDFPRVNCFVGICSIEFYGTNYLTSNWLTKTLATQQQVGIIMADFPGPVLIWQIANRNNPLILP